MGRGQRRNAERVYRSLAAFGAPRSGLTPNDFASEGFFRQMGVPPARVEILMCTTPICWLDRAFSFRVLPFGWTSLRPSRHVLSEVNHL